MADTLPPFFKPILWSYDVSRLDPKLNRRTIIIQTINYGSWKHWRWLVGSYGEAGIRSSLENIPESEFRPSALKLALLLFGPVKMNYASRGSYIRNQKTLAAP